MNTRSTVSIIGTALFPALDVPETKFASGKPVFRLKVEIDIETARTFFVSARETYRAAYPDASAHSVILPLRKIPNGKITVRAETFMRPMMTGDIRSGVRHGDLVRVVGTLAPFKRETGTGLNFRLSMVERLP